MVYHWITPILSIDKSTILGVYPCIKIKILIFPHHFEDPSHTKTRPDTSPHLRILDAGNHNQKDVKPAFLRNIVR
jgi:hypothetical protein